MANWENGETIWWQSEKIEAKAKQKESYGQYFLIGGIIIAVGAIAYYFHRHLCPVYLKSGYYIDVKNFITPSDSDVQAVASQLKSGAISNCAYAAAPITETECKVMEALGYVRDNITYISDKKQHGLLEYWSLPKETLQSGYGDCEDFSWVLASILLALNLPTDTVRVTLGSKDGTGHAWTEVLLNDQWFILEGARGTITLKNEPNGYNDDCYVYKNKCETLNVARYGLHDLLEPLEALAL